MLDGLLNISILLMSFSQFLVSLTSLVVTLILFANVKELSQILDRKFKLTHLFVNKTYLLVTLCLLILVICSLGCV